MEITAPNLCYLSLPGAISLDLYFIFHLLHYITPCHEWTRFFPSCECSCEVWSEAEASLLATMKLISLPMASGDLVIKYSFDWFPIHLLLRR